ncbi:ABC-F family ATP-binding cassette domain-containing protein [Bradyrhizobium sp. SZCCHNS1054]|uniref:ABC-F family ATP-binding cassette domain-containing protein n=1 Tax=Bradyrhizobium sp. SZCCHNS1054 TaxID=3057301 RepID=UPI00291654A7|nr:ABC-F family ATP-binding cassette domain-containing protein [Bradyrhizobium sp. SZCCHNS1054]
MSIIHLRDVGVILSRTLFQAVTLSVGRGDRVGLIGNNGAGKSTFLRCIAGDQEPTSGSIARARGVRIRRIEQEMLPGLERMTLRESVVAALPVSELHSRGWEVEALLDKLEIPESVREGLIEEQSGGWRRLALIARAWIAGFDTLLMDEPTNHLDLSKVLVLERLLGQVSDAQSIIVASHDRRFLDSSTNRTLFLRTGASRYYSASYSTACLLLAADDEMIARQHQKGTRELTRLERSAHDLRQIGVNRHSDAALKKSTQVARRARSIEGNLPVLHREVKANIRLANRTTHAKLPLLIENFRVRAPDGRALFSIRRLEVGVGERVAVLGRNGVGKSQLLHAIHRAATNRNDRASANTISVSSALTVAYLDQEHAVLPAGEMVHSHLVRTCALSEQTATKLLVTAGFGVDQHHAQIGNLSPGQRARLALLVIRLAEANFFILDEPTNHLDIAGQEQLEVELAGNEVTCILVSHDRQFVRNVATRYCLIENDRLREIPDPEVVYAGLSNRRRQNSEC